LAWMAQPYDQPKVAHRHPETLHRAIAFNTTNEL
jgi:hypothetical protein